ncbi:MAG: hypothetical protein EG825_17945, partial [Rhodocyclaceae bacterium]|nr:hypothetical protein [Rhodocyclaceae bacterium]
RRELLSGWLQILVQALFWFHPLVWFAGAQLRHERECACDEAALESGCSQARRYGESLLKVLLAARGRSAVAMGFLGIFERNTRLQRRLEEIMNQETRVRRLGWWGWVSLAVFALLCLPMAALSQKGAPDDLNLTPLHQAAAGGHLDTVKMLIGKGADVNARTQNGRTPLHLAAFGGHMETAEAIIAAGADVNARDNQGNTPLSLASAGGHGNTAEMLIAKGSEVNPVSPDEKAIRDTIKNFWSACEARDPAALRKYVVSPFKDNVSDEEIKKGTYWEFMRDMKVDRVMCSGSTALAITARFRESNSSNKQFFVAFRLVKSDGRWLISQPSDYLPASPENIEKEIQKYRETTGGEETKALLAQY